jgi:hypothetical protein
MKILTVFIIIALVASVAAGFTNAMAIRRSDCSSSTTDKGKKGGCKWIATSNLLTWVVVITLAVSLIMSH